MNDVMWLHIYSDMDTNEIICIAAYARVETTPCVQTVLSSPRRISVILCAIFVEIV